MLRRWIIGSVVAMLLVAGKAEAVELCAAIDGSGSVIFTEGAFELQLEGLAAAVEDEGIVPPTGAVSLAVVLFGSEAETAIPLTTIDSPAAAAGLAAAIRAVIPNEDFAFWHRTNMAAAVSECIALFQDPLQEWIIDLSTDGRHNVETADPFQARDEAVLFGLDVLNAIGVAEADQASLQALVWPQPSSDPPDEGFAVFIATFDDYVDAMRLKVRSEVTLAVDLDIKPRSCPNSFNPERRGVLPVAIPGGAVDVARIDPSSIRLEGVAPLRWRYADVTTPAGSPGAELSCLDCSREGPDGVMDLTLKFRSREVAAALGDVSKGDCLLLTLTGSLQPEEGGRPLSGDDTLRIVGRKRSCR